MLDLGAKGVTRQSEAGHVRSLWAAVALAYALVTTPAQARAPSIPDGVWASEGYGWLLTKKREHLDLFHRTRISCTSDKSEDGPLQDLKGLYIARMDPGQMGFTAYTPENITRFHFLRQKELPGDCLLPDIAASSAVRNFEILWQTFSEQYAFFREHGVDWYEAYTHFRPLVHDGMSDDALFSVMTAMLEGLSDRHVTLTRPGGDTYRSGLGPVVTAFRADYDRLPASGRGPLYDYVVGRLGAFKDSIDGHYLGKTKRSACRGFVTWGSIGSVGYLRVDLEGNYTDADDFKDEARALQQALDAAMSRFSGADGVILDLRFNLGGNDAHSLAIASRFTSTPTIAFSKAARAGKGFTEAQPLRLTPAGLGRFGGKLVVLTSNVTVSAGENLVLSTLAIPTAIRIGERTASAHSDQLMKVLPNGWTFSVSNEVFWPPTGPSYEGVGIPPDLTVPGTFDKEVLSSGRDPVIERALKELQAAPPHSQITNVIRESSRPGSI